MVKLPKGIRILHGAVGSAMLHNVNRHTRYLSNSTGKSYRYSCKKFDTWRTRYGLSNRNIWLAPRRYVELWAIYLSNCKYAPGSVHKYTAGVCCGLQISMAGIARHSTSAEKRRSLGLSKGGQRARNNPRNASIVAFQEMVGGRRSALTRLKGRDFVYDESGEPCVRFIRDKGGKTQLQRIAPQHVEAVRAYFDAVGPDELLFPKIDSHLDLQCIRAEHARSEYSRYLEICSTPEGRQLMKNQLLARYTDPEIGCKAYRLAVERGDIEHANRLRERFEKAMRDGTYRLIGINRAVALERGRPVEYDRLALMCVSVYALSHWRNAVSVKYYML